MPQREGLNWTGEQRQRIEVLLDEYRLALRDSPNDLTEEQRRASITSLLE